MHHKKVSAEVSLEKEKEGGGLFAGVQLISYPVWTPEPIRSPYLSTVCNIVHNTGCKSKHSKVKPFPFGFPM